MTESASTAMPATASDPELDRRIAEIAERIVRQVLAEQANRGTSER